MTAQKSTRKTTARKSAPPAAEPEKAVRATPRMAAEPATEPPQCNVPTCRAEPKIRGLCNPHWATHRGYANPKEKETTGV